jgi:nucleoside-diphosphate-sugar epimerase
MNTCVTGSTGFVGRSLTARVSGPWTAIRFGGEDWRAQLEAAPLRGATIFHLAARVHEHSASEAQFVHDNVEKTRALGEAAARAGARRIVFLSTIKVNSEETRDKPFAARDTPDPQGPYARSKWDAERALRAFPGVEVCVVRSPLVYGAGALGNLRELLRLADSPWPLPFASLHNRRSFVHVDDLARLLIACGSDARAAGATFLAAHEQPISTAKLVATLRHKLSRPRRLYSLPATLLEAMAGPLGLTERMRRLTRNLEVDVTQAHETLGWSAQIGPEEAIDDMVHAYLGTPR